MKCEFCNQSLTFSHHENIKEIEVYDCLHCPVLTSFYYFEDGSRVKTTFILDKNEKSYMWTNHYGKQISYITDLGVDTAKAGRDTTLLRFPKIMNVTPLTVYEKFKFYMVFL